MQDMPISVLSRQEFFFCKPVNGTLAIGRKKEYTMEMMNILKVCSVHTSPGMLHVSCWHLIRSKSKNNLLKNQVEFILTIWNRFCGGDNAQALKLPVLKIFKSDGSSCPVELWDNKVSTLCTLKGIVYYKKSSYLLTLVLF